MDARSEGVPVLYIVWTPIRGKEWDDPVLIDINVGQLVPPFPPFALTGAARLAPVMALSDLHDRGPITAPIKRDRRVCPRTGPNVPFLAGPIVTP